MKKKDRGKGIHHRIKRHIIKHLKKRKAKNEKIEIKIPNNKKIKPIGEHKSRLHKIAAVAIILLFIAYIIFLSNIIKKDCKDDITCFDKMAATCKGARFEGLRDNNVYGYEINGPLRKECIISITLKSMAAGTPVQMTETLEGKSMRCKVPREILEEKSIEEVDNLIEYCSGELKEGLYEIMIDKMYNLIVKNMANITNSVQKDVSRLKSQGL